MKGSENHPPGSYERWLAEQKELGFTEGQLAMRGLLKLALIGYMVFLVYILFKG